MKRYWAIVAILATQTTYANDTSGGKNLDTATETIAELLTMPACLPGATALYKSSQASSALVGQNHCSSTDAVSKSPQPAITSGSGDIQEMTERSNHDPVPH
jgi:hypothetical protein